MVGHQGNIVQPSKSKQMRPLLVINFVITSACTGAADAMEGSNFPTNLRGM